MNRETIQGWVAEQIHLDPATATPALLAKLDDLTARAEAMCVRQLLDLPEFRRLVW
ncbi:MULTISPECIES: hypothetical protein [Rhodococcus]|jgi:hypothetical protein|uniref:hypothetical protein n=1 Tax=Rhodococcus TaxID=1827 RepID=UPI0003171A49|nr:MULTISPECIES: hypothetical protein [Rhodococcus]